ncbi:aminotransferase class I/II-fold pyridoxal phosphate-dependent enzyme [Nocardia arizonensis]|uniref:aminotransferase class I/II-fold pyridoxal phosphate-dependent enzyme n=1 Tax=Nocardia arizonensis TaxID=1141647 RepID=UPI0006D11716|nr:aminotransferase class I/II-fold pyridoxal phosphate-dependent enzyme [Nocardia arizonensis]
MIPTVAEQVQFRVDRFQYGRVVGEWGGRHVAHGRTPGPDAVLLNQDDYLRISGDDRIARAIGDAVAAPPDTSAKPALERALADHMRAPAGVLCQSGWQANIGLLQTIADPRTPVYIDGLAHMSLWQGAKVAGAPLHPFRHNFPADLREKIRTYGPGVIVVEAMYGGTGSRSPLAQLCDVAEQTGSLLVVDESHTLGTDGPLGAGGVVALGLAERVPFRTASLSKAMAGRAGFVCVNGTDFVDYFTMESYPTVFSTDPLPHEIAGLAAALDIVRADDWRRERLREVSGQVRTALAAMGFEIGAVASPLIALPGGPDQRAIAIRDFLEERGVFGTVLCPPSTPRHRTLIRFALHAGLSDVDVERIVLACEQVRETFGTVPPAPIAPRADLPVAAGRAAR